MEPKATPIINSANDLIVASATPPGTSGLAVIRLSGATSVEVVSKMLASKRNLLEMPTSSCTVGWFSKIDEVVVTKFVAPYSFTGENMVEISCHGGIAVKQMIIETCLKAGARLANPGEFSQRAFENGKIDLTKAEAIIALINAEAVAQAKVAASNLKGGLKQTVDALIADVLDILTQLELLIEFTEQEQPQVEAKLQSKLANFEKALAQLCATSKQGKILSHGLQIVLAGAPNAGKSTLLNALCGEDRAIVTPIAGTTRDTIEVRITCAGKLVILTDTAGLRETTDVVEGMGVLRTKQAIAKADAVLYLYETGTEAEIDWQEINNIKREKPLRLICTKVDKEVTTDKEADTSVALNWQDEVISWSNQQEETLQNVLACIEAITEDLIAGCDSNVSMLTEIRQVECCEQALASLREATRTLQDGWPLEMAATLLHYVHESLASITGQDAREEFVTKLFSTFCVGK